MRFGLLKRRLRKLSHRDRPKTSTVPPRDLAAWAAEYLVVEGKSASVSMRPENDMHRWLCREFDRLDSERGQRLGVLGPRGYAKSSWGTFAYPLKCALNGTEPYIVITSDTRPQAEKHLEAIRTTVETNDKLASAYPRACRPGSVWRNDRLQLANGVVIEALGTGMKLRGRRHLHHRPSLIGVDDPQNKDHIISQLQRERSWEWLMKDVCNAGGPRTNIFVMGTALHRECIVCKLLATPGWKTKVWKAIIEWPQRMDLWAEWERVYQDYDMADDERERAALEFYQRHKGEMEK